MDVAKNSGIKLDIRNLEYSVWGKKILSGSINLSLYPGEFIGLLGPSGSGKSTLLKACCGIIKPSDGNVFFNRDDFYKNPQKWRDKIGYVPQDDIIHMELTVEKAVDYAARLRLSPDLSEERRKALVSKAIIEVGLQERAKVRIRKVSGGQRKRASIAVELLNRPSMLFLDEPTSGQDPQLEESLMQLFQRLTKEGTTIIVTTHAMASIEMVNLVALLQAGKLVYFGPPQALLDFFDTKSYEGVFKNLVKENPDYWITQYRNSSYYQDYILKRLRS